MFKRLHNQSERALLKLACGPGYNNNNILPGGSSHRFQRSGEPSTYFGLTISRRKPRQGGRVSKVITTQHEILALASSNVFPEHRA